MKRRRLGSLATFATALAGCVTLLDLQHVPVIADDGGPLAEASVPADGSSDAVAEVVGDAPGPSIDAADAPDSGARCDPTAPFGPPTSITVPVGSGWFGAKLTADEREDYLKQINGQVWVATRATPTGDFVDAHAVPSIITAASDPAISGDGLTLYYNARFDGGTTGDDLFVARRSKRTDPFGDASLVVQANSAADESESFVTADGGELWFVRHTTSDDIFRVRLDIADAEAEPVTSLNTGLDERLPVLSGDMRGIVFGRVVSGKLDMFTAYRANDGDDFSDATSIDELNTDASDDPGWLSPDGCRLYFVRRNNPSQLMMSVRDH